MSTLNGKSVASTYDQVVKRQDSYSATGNQIEIMDDSGVIKTTPLYLDSVNSRVGIGTASPGSELDLAGGYMANEQGRQNHVANTMPAPYYRFDGVDDYITLSDAFNSSILTYALWIKTSATSAQKALDARDAGGDGTQLAITSGGIVSGAYNGETSTTSSTAINDGDWHFIAWTYDGSTSQIYIDGVADGSSQSYTATISVTQTARIGARSFTSPSEYFDGEMSGFKFYNKALTATEVKELYSGASVPFKYKGANQTELTSGTLTIGKKYRINNWITNDDFTNIGGTNEDGNEFVATGTTPTTWTNSSTVVPIGAVAEYDGSSASEEHWFDTSGNDLHGDVTGATLNNQGDGGATKAITLTPRALPSTANASEGQIVYDSSANKLKVYNGSAWETITSS